MLFVRHPLGIAWNVSTPAPAYTPPAFPGALIMAVQRHNGDLMVIRWRVHSGTAGSASASYHHHSSSSGGSSAAQAQLLARSAAASPAAAALIAGLGAAAAAPPRMQQFLFAPIDTPGGRQVQLHVEYAANAQLHVLQVTLRPAAQACPTSPDYT